MGVPGLFPWLNGNFKNFIHIFSQGEKRYKVDALYLDANGLLHGAAQDIFNYGQNKRMLDPYADLSYESKLYRTFTLFFAKIVSVVEMIMPTQILYIAIDGPAPLAKQAQQRQRRYLSAEHREENMFDSNAITPGTSFMDELTKYLVRSLFNKMNESLPWRKFKIYFSPPTVPGEGEHKIMDFIRTMDSKTKQSLRHCIYGPDGDLVMLTLATHCEKIKLFRDDQFSYDQYTLTDIGEVRRNLPYKLGEARSIQMRKRRLDDVSNDFILIGFFVGNDFLPMIQMFKYLKQGLKIMIQEYSRLNKGGTVNQLTINDSISFDGFKVFINEISKMERGLLEERVGDIPDDEKFTYHTLIKHGKVIDKENNVYALDFDGFRKDYYEKAHVHTEAEIRDMCYAYLRGLIWVFEYYIHGLPSWRWFYNYHYAPLMGDLTEFLNNFQDFESIYKFEIGQPSEPFEQLLSVLPKKSSNLLPIGISKLMKSETSPLVKGGNFPTDVKIDYEGKRKEHEGIVLLPFIDNDLIREIYTSLPEKEKNFQRNQRGSVMLFTYDQNVFFTYRSKYGDIDGMNIKREYVENKYKK